MTNSSTPKDALAIDHLINDAVLLLGFKIEVLNNYEASGSEYDAYKSEAAALGLPLNLQGSQL
jgi:hypothetical protein